MKTIFWSPVLFYFLSLNFRFLLFVSFLFQSFVLLPLLSPVFRTHQSVTPASPTNLTACFIPIFIAMPGVTGDVTIFLSRVLHVQQRLCLVTCTQRF